MSTLNLVLKNVLLDQVNKFSLTNGTLAFLGSWGDEEALFLKFCLQHDIILMEELTEAVHQRLLILGRENYQFHLQSNVAPDHILSPHALAYALKHSVFAARELKKIKFDHQESPSTFMPEQASTLLDRVVAQLQQGREKFEILKDG